MTFPAIWQECGVIWTARMHKKSSPTLVPQTTRSKWHIRMWLRGWRSKRINKFDSTRLGVDIFFGKRWCFPCNSKLLIPNYKLVVSFIQGPDNQSSIELRTGALIYSNYETPHLPVCENRDLDVNPKYQPIITSSHLSVAHINIVLSNFAVVSI